MPRDPRDLRDTGDPDDPPDQGDPPVGGEPGPDGGTAKPKPDPLADVKAILDNAAKIATTATKASSDAIRAAEIARQTPHQAPPPPAAVVEEEPDVDWSDAKAVKGYVDRKITAGVSKGLETFGKQIDGVYTKDRLEDLNWRAAAEKRDAKSRLPGFSDLEAEIDAYVAQIPEAHRYSALARPGAWDEAYYRVLGEKEAERRRDEALRAGPVSASGRSATMDTRDAIRIPADVQAAVRSRLGGVDVDAEELTFFQGADADMGVGNFRDWQEFEAKRQTRRGGRVQ